MNEQDPDTEQTAAPHQPEQRKDFSGLVERIKNHLLLYYVPVHDPKEAAFHYSTLELHRLLQRVFPGDGIYSLDDVALWLHNAGFTFADYGDLKLEWMMNKA